MARFVNPLPQFALANNTLAAGGKLYFYATGTDTLLDIFADVDESIPIANPVTLGARGQVPNIFFSESARCQFVDKDGVQIFDVDPVNSGGLDKQFAPWDSNVTYAENDIAYGSDGNPYISLDNDNQGNDPTVNVANSDFWSPIVILEKWNAQKTYNTTDLVVTQGILYVSVTDGNTGNDPFTDGAVNWLSIADASNVIYDNDASGLLAVTGQAAIDELKSIIDNLPSSINYRGQLDVSSGDSALPSAPQNGDLYLIGVGGTITVSQAGNAPAPIAVSAGDQIIYNGDLEQWDLVGAVTLAASVGYTNSASDLSAANVQDAIDEVSRNGQVVNVVANGGTLDPFRVNQVETSGGTYDVPLAANYATNKLLVIEVCDLYKAGDKTLDVSGSDLFEFADGTDNQIILKDGFAGRIYLTSNGVDKWRY